MKKHRIFNKGEFTYCLLSSYNRPNVLIPVRAIIIDTKWDPVNPRYRVKILKFYDSMLFLKKNFFDMNFSTSFEIKAKPIPLKKEDYPNVASLEQRLDEKDAERFYVTVDSIMCTKTRIDLSDLFEKVQFYLISKNFKEIRDFSTRSFFKGPLSLDSNNEFNVKFKLMWSSKFDGNLDIDKYLESLG
jgi:hypothetical protein